MKKVQQVNKAGNIVIDYDQRITRKEMDALFADLFGNAIKKDNKQYILLDKIGILACNVTYLGNPHPIYKKRIQLKKYYLDYLIKNNSNGISTIYLGIYTYCKTRLFVVFEPTTYAGKKSHNSSAHVYSVNLQYAKRAGKYEKTDAFGNHIHVFDTYEFVKYMKSLANDGISLEYDDVGKVLNNYVSAFKLNIKNKWKGIDCYKEMVKSDDENARQSEWPGWYFEFLFKNYLKENSNSLIKWNKSKKKGEIDLDLKFTNNEWVYGDLKADQIGNNILGNDLNNLDKVLIDNHGVVYYVCCLYKAEKDSKHGYRVSKYWNNNVREKKKRYKTMDELINGYGNKMKYLVRPQLLCVLKIDEVMYNVLKKKPFSQGVNSNGKKRPDKLAIQKDMAKALSIYTQELN